MNIWFVVYFFGHIVMFVGPFNDSNTSISQALEKCHYGQAMFNSDLEDSKDDLKYHPLPNGKILTVEDIKTDCIQQAEVPVIDNSIGTDK